MRTRGAFVAIATLVLLCRAAAAQELRNDGFVTGQQVGFQAGFVSGEIGAVDLIAPSPSMRLDTVRLLFGGATSTQTITLRVWDASAATLAPGAELFSGDFQLTGSNTALHEIDLSSMGVIVPTRFRVGIQLQHAGLPCIARDNDGNISPTGNFIYANLGTGFQWFRSQTLGLTGDWVVRGVVTTLVIPDAAVPDAAIDAPSDGGSDALVIDAPPDAPADASTDAATDALPPDASTGECQGNGDCATGSYCSPENTCTFDCRNDNDCGDDHCNTLGQCVPEQHPSGCCDTGGTPHTSLASLLLAGLVAITLRRKRIRRIV